MKKYLKNKKKKKKKKKKRKKNHLYILNYIYFHISKTIIFYFKKICLTRVSKNLFKTIF